ncbi:MAG: hypothetical protein RL095_1498 [Verrucomicrobiota bacterium]|jgi:D-tyrosyl-tRNA(Tyr) deacylase
MIAVLQRCTRASVTCDGVETGRICRGLVLLVGIARGDGEADAEWLLKRLAELRIFADAEGKTNLDAAAAGAAILAVPQFTLLADAHRGRRPSLDAAAPPDEARRLWAVFQERLSASSLPCGFGVFGADMQVELVNDGPFTLVLDSKRR